MKSIRNIAFSALLSIGAFTAITYTSCNKDECKDVVCQNSGTCDPNTGACVCTTGYEGTNCADEVRGKFIKTWTATDKKVSDNSAVPTYTSSIVKGTSVTDVLISKFSNAFFDNDVKATVSGTKITIATQAPDGDGYTVSGSADYNTADKKLTWSYTLTSPISGAASFSGTWQ